MKKIRTLLVGYALVLVLFVFAQQRQQATAQPGGFHAVMDLTHPLDAKALAAQSKALPQGISQPKDSGTNLEAPAQYDHRLWSVDQIPAERLLAPLVVIDARDEVQRNSDYVVSVEDIVRWEHAHGQIHPGAVVAVRTGWESRWTSHKDFRNADTQGVLHFPGFSSDAAKFLVEARGVFGLGTDTLSVDAGKATDLPVHSFALAHSVYQLESLANLDRVPENGAMVVVSPLKLEGSEVSPARVLALVK